MSMLTETNFCGHKASTVVSLSWKKLIVKFFVAKYEKFYILCMEATVALDVLCKD